MALDPNDGNQPILLIEVMGGRYPTQRRTRSWLKVPQSQLSQALQKIHRFGGRILRVEPMGEREEGITLRLEPSQAISAELFTPQERESPEPAPVMSIPERVEALELAEISIPPQERESPEPDPVMPVPPMRVIAIEEEENAIETIIELPKVEWERTQPTRIYSLFPPGKVKAGTIKPVCRQWRKKKREACRFWLPSRELSIGKQRRVFFRSQSPRRRRRR